MTFEDLNVKTEIVRALKEDDIITPTKIQSIAIPIIQAGKDLIGISNTGSGKTLAFSVPVLEKIDPKGGLQVLILTPTRELAVQITKEMKKFSKYMRCNFETVYGGVAIGPQIQNLEKANVVVGTTGRLLDHLQRRTINLSKIKTIILDEADKMVDMGFIDDIHQLLRNTPKDTQKLLFGATISSEINQIKEQYMKNPEVAKADSYVREDFLEQIYYNVMPGEKFSYLMHLLNKEETERVMIFCSTRSNCEILTKNLRAQKTNVAMLHGKMSQNARQRVIDEFNKGKPKILVASAVAARGLDIRNVSHVFNYGLSNDPQEYIHRIGRTARAGESGIAITLLEPRDHDAFGQILSKYHMNVKEMQKEKFDKLRFQVDNKRGSYGRSRDDQYGLRVQQRSFNRSPAKTILKPDF